MSVLRILPEKYLHAEVSTLGVFKFKASFINMFLLLKF